MRNLLIAAAGILFFAFVPGDKLVGRWETKPSANGHTTGVVFKADGAFEGYVNKKPFVS
ncbi:MAG TPA: hypothetical protein VEV87_07790 [Chitinophagaceae bacterium]|nr:hypothetical protein [Chitinophagaceae bacterium]